MGYPQVCNLVLGAILLSTGCQYNYHNENQDLPMQDLYIQDLSIVRDVTTPPDLHVCANIKPQIITPSTNGKERTLFDGTNCKLVFDNCDDHVCAWLNYTSAVPFRSLCTEQIDYPLTADLLRPIDSGATWRVNFSYRFITNDFEFPDSSAGKATLQVYLTGLNSKVIPGASFIKDMALGGKFSPSIQGSVSSQEAVGALRMILSSTGRPGNSSNPERGTLELSYLRIEYICPPS